MKIKELYSLFKESTEIVTDSRKITKGCLFFALKGEKFDGNNFAEGALKEGAKFAIIDNPEYKKDSSYILVDNVLSTLQDLARYHVSKLKPKLRVIGLTGSNGKTTTKELIAGVLSSSFKVQYTAGNLNNHIGVPLTILKIKEETEIAVIEMGANHHGEIALLASIAMPDIGLITNIGEAHIEGFGSLEGVLKAKSELFDYLKKEKGILLINLNDIHIAKKFGQKQNHNALFYGTGKNSLVNGNIVESSSEAQVVSLQIDEKEYKFKTNLVGQYNLDNFLAAATIGNHFGISAEHIIKSLSKYKPTLNRSQFMQTGKNKLIIDAYNANPTSMMAALDNFKKLNSKNKVVILGGMKELGKSSKSYHLRTIEFLNSANFDKVFLVGEEFMKISHTFSAYKNVSELIEVFKMNRIENSTILIKGSRANSLEKIIESL